MRQMQTPEENERLRLEIRAYLAQHQMTFGEFADRASVNKSTISGFLCRIKGASPEFAQRLRSFMRQESAAPSAGSDLGRDLRLRLRAQLSEFGGSAPQLAKAIGLTTRALKKFLDAGSVSKDDRTQIIQFLTARAPAPPSRDLVKAGSAPLGAANASGRQPAESTSVAARSLLAQWQSEAMRFVIQSDPLGDRLFKDR